MADVASIPIHLPAWSSILNRLLATHSRSCWAVPLTLGHNIWNMSGSGEEWGEGGGGENQKVKTYYKMATD